MSRKKKFIFSFLIVMIMTGVFSFRHIEAGRDSRYRAIFGYPQANMIEIGKENGSNTSFNRDYSLYYTLGGEFPGASYIIPSASAYVSKKESINRLLAFSRASTVNRESYEFRAEKHKGENNRSLLGDIDSYDASNLWVIKEPAANTRHPPWVIVINRHYDSQRPREFRVFQWSIPHLKDGDAENPLWYQMNDAGHDHEAGVLVLDQSLLEQERDNK